MATGMHQNDVAGGDDMIKGTAETREVLINGNLLTARDRRFRAMGETILAALEVVRRDVLVPPHRTHELPALPAIR
jgi:hypothetical protein